MKYLQFVVVFFICLGSLVSCVSKKKFLDATNTISLLRQDSTRFENELGVTRNSLKETQQMVADLEKRLKDLDDAKAQREKELSDAQRQLSSTREKLSSTEQQLNTTALTVEEQQKRLEDLQRLIDQQRSVVQKLRQSIDKALGQYNAEDLDVYVKNGKVYVSLQEKLLFKSGSAVVGKEGQEALGKIANVLNTDPKIQIVVEGHTDSIPIKRTFEDNWALSTARAVSIVRILTNTYKVDPARVVASGHSYFDPRDTNTTPEGRALNRRTEIILSPNLDELYKLMQ